MTAALILFIFGVVLAIGKHPGWSAASFVAMTIVLVAQL